MATATPLEMLHEQPDEPDISRIVTEDDAPLDSLPSERQQRLLVEPLYSSWSGPPDELPGGDGPRRLFLAATNVGLFAAPDVPPVVPDFFLSLDVLPGEPIWEKKNRSYFYWVFGKPPELVLEVVSNREGGELADKLRKYARMRIAYYVVYDPARRLGEQTLHAFELRGSRYVPIDPWFEDFGLGLVEWDGEYDDVHVRWLRWRTRDGALLPTGAEAAAKATTRAQQAEVRAGEAEVRAGEAEARARRLAERLRALGIDPEDEPGA